MPVPEYVLALLPEEAANEINLSEKVFRERILFGDTHRCLSEIASRGKTAYEHITDLLEERLGIDDFMGIFNELGAHLNSLRAAAHSANDPVMRLELEVEKTRHECALFLCEAAAQIHMASRAATKRDAEKCRLHSSAAYKLTQMADSTAKPLPGLEHAISVLKAWIQKSKAG